MRSPVVSLKRPIAAEEQVPPDLSRMDRAIKRTWFTRAGIVLSGIVLILAGATAVAYMKYGLGRTLTVSRDRVVISTVQRGTFLDYIPVTGNIVPRNTAYLDAVEGGQVAQVLVEEGATVEIGEALVKLNNTNLQLEVIGREAQLTEQINQLNSTKLAFEQGRLAHAKELIDVEFQLDQAARLLERRKALQLSAAVSRSDVDDSQREWQRLQRLRHAILEAQASDLEFQGKQLRRLDAAVESMNQNFAIARGNLDSLVVKAPIAGQLTALEAHLGESKAPGQRIGQVDGLDTFKVSAAVDEFYLGRVNAGQKATAEIDGTTYPLNLAKVYPQVTDRQFKIDLLFDAHTPPAIRRGQTLQLRLEIGAAGKSMIVANGPFYEDTGGAWAFVVTPSGAQAERHAVKLGRRNPESVEVLGGLVEGDRVITSSYEALKAFDHVRLRGAGS